jgi:hypothetical protein
LARLEQLRLLLPVCIVSIRNASFALLTVSFHLKTPYRAIAPLRILETEFDARLTAGG